MDSSTKTIKEKAQQVSQVVAEHQNVGNKERIVSALAGILLTIYGVKKKNTLAGKGLSIIGGMLLTRASSGFCPVNRALGRNSFSVLGA